MARKYLLTVLCTLLPIVSNAQPSTGAEDVISYQGGTWSLGCDVSDLFALDTSVDGVETLLTAIQTALQIIDDWDSSDRAQVNIVVGQAGVAAGSGASGSNTIRTMSASDDLVAIATAQEDTSTVSGQRMMRIGAVQSASPANSAGATGDMAELYVYNGQLFVQELAAQSLDTKFPDPGQLTDDMAKGDVSQIGAFGMMYDGSAWDMQRGDATNGTLVNLGSNNDVTVTMPGSATVSQVSLTNNTSTTVLAANASRKKAWITNPTSGVTIWCTENAVAVVGQGAPIFYGGSYEVISDDIVRCIQNSGSSQNANAGEAS